MLRFSLIILLMLITVPAKAQDSLSRSEIRQQLVSSCKFWENCGQYFKQRSYTPRHYELHRFRPPEVTYERNWRDDRYREERYSQECRDFVTAVGEERYGRDRAKEAAEQTWMESVRSRYGVKWIDLRNARHGTWECGRSSTGNRASEKAQEVVGKFLEQCELKARPCRAELERVTKD